MHGQDKMRNIDCEVTLAIVDRITSNLDLHQRDLPHCGGILPGRRA